MDKRLAPTGQYKYAAVPITGGLDFVNPPSMVAPGTLTDCLNYEFVDRNGLRRVDGYYKWDGAYTLEGDQEYSIGISEITAGAPAVGHFLSRTSTSPPFGIITNIVPHPIGGQAIEVYYLRLSSGVEPAVSQTFTTLASGAIRPLWTALTVPAPLARHPFIDLSSNFGSPGTPLLNTDYGDSSAGAGHVLALKHFENSPYAVMDAAKIEISGVSTRLYAGDVIGDEVQAIILLNPALVSGTWSSGVARSDYLYIEPSRQSATYTPSFPRLFTSSSIGGTLLARRGDGFFSGTSVQPRGQATNAILYRGYSIAELLNSGPAPTGNIEVSAGAAVTAPPTIAITGGSGYGAAAVALWDAVSGVRSIALTSAGNNYTAPPTIGLTGGGGATGDGIARNWDWCGWRAINTGWKVPVVTGNSASGFLTKLDRQRGPTAQVAAYGTGEKIGVPFSTLTSLDFSGAQTFGSTWYPSTGNVLDPTYVQTVGSNTLNVAVRDVSANVDMRTQTLGLVDFSEIRNNVPANSVISGVEVIVTHSTSGSYFSAATAPTWQARCALFKTTDATISEGIRVETRLGDFKSIDLSQAALPATTTFGASTDLWGNEGFRVEDLTANFGIALDYFVNKGFTPPAFDFQVLVDKVELKVYYRDPTIKYYFASGTATDRNVVSATLVAYNKEKGELTQGNWEGIFQVADMVNEKYCPNTGVGFVEITAPGTSYTTATTATFVGGTGTPATATAVVNNGAIVGVHITNAGNYTVPPTGITFTVGTGATVNIVMGATPGAMQGFGVFLDSGLTVRIGTVKSTMSYNGLDSYSAIEAAKSRYEMIAANFYANEQWGGIYGVSGAGRPFYFDGNYFSRIYAISLETPESEAKDKPRHITNYRYHLAVAYNSGSVLFSKPGDPEVFDAVLGAGEVGIGDPVTGILPLPGQYLAVFCQNSIWGITGKTVDEFSLENIVPSSGAIEYSVTAIGDKPIFCDTLGISTLAQAQEYGNFVGNRLSHKVTPWLLPRLTNTGRGYGTGNTAGFIAAYPVRSKNQYRLWFRDGVQLVMSFLGAEQQPEFTFMKYIMGGVVSEANSGSPADNYKTSVMTNCSDKVQVLAVTSDVDTFGNENILFSYDYDKSEMKGTGAFTSLSNAFVFRAEYLNQFGEFSGHDGAQPQTSWPLGIPAYFQTSFSTVENPFTNKTIRKVRVEGATRGVSSLAVTVGKNYVRPNPLTAPLSDVPLDRIDTLPWRDKSDYDPASNLTNVAQTDRVLTVLCVHTTKAKMKIIDGTAVGMSQKYIVTKNPASGQGRLHYCEPAHYVQMMLIQYEEGREDA